jgi:hypothetical protein
MSKKADRARWRRLQELGKALDAAEAAARPYGSWDSSPCRSGHTLGWCPECGPIWRALAAAEQAYFEAARAAEAARRPELWPFNPTKAELDAYPSLNAAFEAAREFCNFESSRERIDYEIALETREHYLDMLGISWARRYHTRKRVAKDAQAGKLKRVRTITIGGEIYQRTGRYDIDRATGERFEILKRLEKLT